MVNNQKQSTLLQFITFCLIGVLNTLVHFILFISIVDTINSQALANGLAFIGGVLCSYVLNAIFTFKEKPTIFALFKMIATSGSLSVIFGGIGDYLCLTPIVTFLIYVIFNPVLNFYLTKKIVFNK